MTLNNCAIIPNGWSPTGAKPAPGTGPFILKSFVPNEITEFTRFNEYWEYDEKTGDRLPYLDSIYQKKMVDDAVRWTALRAGDIDCVDSPPLHIVAKAILEEPIPGIYMRYILVGNLWIWFNVSKPPFDNKKVRQAVAYALDKKQMLKGMFWGLGEVENNQPFRSLSRFYVPVKDREVDLAKAKQLLAEAGYPNGFKTEFLEYSVHHYTVGAEVTIGQLKKIGIEATVRTVDRAPYFTMMRKGEYSISFGSGDERYDWDDAFYMYYHSSEVGNNNWSRYTNKELDRLLEKGRTTTKREDRVPIYKSAIEILMEDLPVLYISKTVVGSAYANYIKGWREGFGFRYAFHGGGTKYWWLDK